jgi:hypothetical protein
VSLSLSSPRAGTVFEYIAEMNSIRFMAASKVLGEETVAGQGNTQSSRDT